jgi:hypothetical protein
MKLAVLVVMLVAACQAGGSGGGGDDYPVGPGGGGQTPIGGGGRTDAGTGDGGTDAGDGGVALTGRVCLLGDLRSIGTLASCKATGARGLLVTLGTRSATTADDGSFVISVPPGGGFSWHVTSGNTERIEPSVMAFGSDATIPAITVTDYLELLNTNTMTLLDQQGSILVRVLKGGAPLAGVTGVLLGSAVANETHYDTNSAAIWGTAQTAGAGMVWFAGVPLANTPPTQVQVKLTVQGASVTQTVPVENQAITFVTAEFP